MTVNWNKQKLWKMPVEFTFCNFRDIHVYIYLDSASYEHFSSSTAGWEIIKAKSHGQEDKVGNN